MTLTKKEAKEKCIKMWEHIAEHITDKEWRDKAYALNDDTDVAVKIWTNIELWHDPRLPECYLCEVFPQVGCEDCPLGPNHVQCGDTSGPWYGFYHALDSSKYKRAKKAANRLVEKVRAWEVG